MTGQEKILALRRSGRSPRTVWVNDFRCAAADGKTVSLSVADVPEQQDWRFLVGLTVIVSAYSEERLARIAKAAGEFAKRVIANLHSTTSAPHGYSTTAYPVLKITDTEGVLTWPA